MTGTSHFIAAKISLFTLNIITISNILHSKSRQNTQDKILNIINTVNNMDKCFATLEGKNPVPYSLKSLVNKIPSNLVQKPFQALIPQINKFQHCKLICNKVPFNFQSKLVGCGQSAHTRPPLTAVPNAMNASLQNTHWLSTVNSSIHFIFQLLESSHTTIYHFKAFP